MKHAPPARDRRRKPSRGRLIARRATAAIGVAVLVLGVVAGAAIWKLQSNIDTQALGDSLVEDATPTGATNILFIGSDSRDLSTTEYGSASETARSDALMLVHFSAKNTRIDAVQIPRDTLTMLPACKDTGSGAFAGGMGMINSALAAGPACSVRAVEQLSNVRVDHFVQLDFEGFAAMINALGSVDVCLETPLVDPDAKLDLPAGKQALDGKDALALARTRHAVGDGSDIGRLGHQQVVMSSIIEQARSNEVLTRPDRLFKFLNALTNSITVDEGISSISALTGLAKRARSVPDDAITFVTMPNGVAPSDPNRVVKTEDADTIFAAVGSDRKMPVTSDDPDASSDNAPAAPVTVLNAAQTDGLASRAQTSLIDLGYTVTGVRTAQKAAAKTRIFIDSTPESKATAEALNKAFGFDAEIVEQPTGMTGVWLILGADRITAGTDPVEPKPVKATTRTASDSLCA